MSSDIDKLVRVRVTVPGLPLPPKTHPKHSRGVLVVPLHIAFPEGALAEGGGSGTPVLDPATLNLSGYWTAPYAGSPWAPTASAGASGSNGNLVTSIGQPGIGSPVNGFEPATFDGVNKSFSTDVAFTSDLISSTGPWTVIVFAKANAAASSAAEYWDDVTLVSDNAGNWGLVFTQDGVRGGVFIISGSKTSAFIPQNTGEWFMAVIRWDGSHVKVRVNNTDATPVAASGSVGLGPSIFIGKNYTEAAHFNGEMLDVITAQYEVTDAELDDLYLSFLTKYGV